MKHKPILVQLAAFEWKHKNLILLAIAIILSFYIIKTPETYSIIKSLGNFGYLGAFVAGLFFSYGLTTFPAIAVLVPLGKELNPLLISILGAAGALISDYLIFRFVRDRLVGELKLVSKELHMTFLHKFTKSKLFLKSIPIIAGFILASPLPDEFAASLFAVAHYRVKHFVIFSFLFNFLGILLITTIGALY